MLTISIVFYWGNCKKVSGERTGSRQSEPIFPTLVWLPAGMCSFSRHGEGDRDSYCCRTKLNAQWMGLQAPSL